MRISTFLATLAAATANAGTLTLFDSSGAHLLGSGIQSAGIAFGPTGQVLEIVDTAGTLTQFDSIGSHLLGSGVRSADVAFGPSGEVQDVVFNERRSVPV